MNEKATHRSALAFLAGTLASAAVLGSTMANASTTPTSTTHRFGLPFTAFVGDRALHKVTNLRLPAAGHWVLDGEVAIHVNVTYGSTGGPATSRYLYVSCELHGLSNKFIGGADASMDTDVYGNGFENLTVNGVVTATSTSRTASLWCRADLNASDSSSLVHNQYVWAQILATRVATFS